MANDFSNLFAELFPSWSMFESTISTRPILSRSNESLGESIKLASFTLGGLYVVAIKSGLNFGLLISIHYNFSLFGAK